MNDIDMSRLENGLKVTVLTQNANFFFLTMVWFGVELWATFSRGGTPK